MSEESKRKQYLEKMMKESRTILEINKKFVNSIKDEYKEKGDYENELLNCINLTLKIVAQFDMAKKGMLLQLDTKMLYHIFNYGMIFATLLPKHRENLKCINKEVI